MKQGTILLDESQNLETFEYLCEVLKNSNIKISKIIFNRQKEEKVSKFLLSNLEFDEIFIEDDVSLEGIMAVQVSEKIHNLTIRDF